MQGRLSGTWARKRSRSRGRSGDLPGPGYRGRFHPFCVSGINLQVNAFFFLEELANSQWRPLLPTAASIFRSHDNQTNRMALSATPKVGGFTKLKTNAEMAGIFGPPSTSLNSCSLSGSHMYCFAEHFRKIFDKHPSENSRRQDRCHFVQQRKIRISINNGFSAWLPHQEAYCASVQTFPAVVLNTTLYRTAHHRMWLAQVAGLVVDTCVPYREAIQPA